MQYHFQESLKDCTIFQLPIPGHTLTAYRDGQLIVSSIPIFCSLRQKHGQEPGYADLSLYFRSEGRPGPKFMLKESLDLSEAGYMSTKGCKSGLAASGVVTHMRTIINRCDDPSAEKAILQKVTLAELLDRDHDDTFLLECEGNDNDRYYIVTSLKALTYTKGTIFKSLELFQFDRIAKVDDKGFAHIVRDSIAIISAHVIVQV